MLAGGRSERPLLPSATLRGFLAGAAALGLEADRLRACCLPIAPERLDVLAGWLPGMALDAFWHGATSMAPGEEALPSELALAVPFGAFGVIDYLAGSAGSVAEAVWSLERSQRLVTSFFRIHVEPRADEVVLRFVQLRTLERAAQAVEASVAGVLGRLRQSACEPLRARVSLTGVPPDSKTLRCSAPQCLLFRAPPTTASVARRLTARVRPAAWGVPGDLDGLQEVAPRVAAQSAGQ